MTFAVSRKRDAKYDGDANGNVTWKYKIAFLVLLHDYSNSFSLFNFSRKTIAWNGVQLKTGNKNVTFVCSRSSQKPWIWSFHVNCCFSKDGEELDCTCVIHFGYKNVIALCSRCRRHSSCLTEFSINMPGKDQQQAHLSLWLDWSLNTISLLETDSSDCPLRHKDVDGCVTHAFNRLSLWPSLQHRRLNCGEAGAAL